MLLIKNIGRLVTMVEDLGQEGPLGVIEDAILVADQGKIVWFGSKKDLPRDYNPEDVIDAGGKLVMPGFVDCHTHLVHGGSRQNEFNIRSNGKTYQEIAKVGGGILSTVSATRATSADELLLLAKARADEAMSYGTSTMEIKTGYGLDLASEEKLMAVIGKLKKNHPLNILGTFMGAHVVPKEFKDKRDEYVNLVIEKMLPEAKKSGVITACDIFVEEGAFGRDETAKISTAAKSLGLNLHLHVDQFADTGGGALAAELGALSADHIDHSSEKSIKAMASKGVVGVVLPGASFFAGRGSYPNARKMINLGLQVAIATDYNPGTNPSLNLLLAATIAVTQMGMTCDEALLGITKHAALALGLADRGVVASGRRADLVIADVPDEYFLLYRYGVNFVSKVIINGEMVLNRESA